MEHIYEGLLRLDVPVGVTLIGYADDLALVVVGRSNEMLVTNAALMKIDVG